MTMILKCDVCDEEFDPDELSWAEFKLPASWLANQQAPASEVLALDICSVECLMTLAQALNPVPDEPSRPEPDNEDEPESTPWQPPDPGFEVTVR